MTAHCPGSYATEATSAVRDYAFGQLGIGRLYRGSNPTCKHDNSSNKIEQPD